MAFKEFNVDTSLALALYLRYLVHSQLKDLASIASGANVDRQKLSNYFKIRSPSRTSKQLYETLEDYILSVIKERELHAIEISIIEHFVEESFLYANKTYKNSNFVYINRSKWKENRISIEAIKTRLLQIATELMKVNDEDTFQARNDLVAYLKALLIFLGDETQETPSHFPRQIAEHASKTEDRLVKASKNWKAMADSGMSVTKLIEKIIELVT